MAMSLTAERRFTSTSETSADRESMARTDAFAKAADSLPLRPLRCHGYEVLNHVHAPLSPVGATILIHFVSRSVSL
jgi:hypothetical protein